MTLEKALKIANDIACQLTSITAIELIELIFEEGIEQ